MTHLERTIRRMPRPRRRKSAGWLDLDQRIVWTTPDESLTRIGMRINKLLRLRRRMT